MNFKTTKSGAIIRHVLTGTVIYKTMYYVEVNGRQMGRHHASEKLAEEYAKEKGY